MADNVDITPGSGATVGADEVTDGTLGTVKVQFTKLMDGTLDGTNKAAVDSSGRLAVQVAAAADAIAKAEDVASANADVGVPAMAVRKASPVNTSGTDGDYEMLQMSAGRLWTHIAASGFDPTSTTSMADTIGISDKVELDVCSFNYVYHAANNSFDRQRSATADALAATGLAAAATMVYNGSTWDRVRGDTTNGVWVNVKTAAIAGDVASGSSDSGNPVKLGGVARTANPTAVTDGQRVNASFDKVGRQLVTVGQPRALIAKATTTIASSSAETTILAAGASGVFHDLTHLILTNASGTAVTVTIKDATAGTTQMILDLAANGGVNIPFERPVPQTTAANNWTATLSSSSVTVHIFAMADKNV